MSQRPNIRAEAEEIASTKDYSRLDKYRDYAVWSTFAAEDQERLAYLYVQQGAEELRAGDSRAKETLDLAVKLAPERAYLRLVLAQVYCSESHNIRCLNLACESCEAALNIEPVCAHAWLMWGKLLVHMGNFHHDSQYFSEAENKFERAKADFEGAEDQDLLPNLYWEWGQCWFCRGINSGEAMDFRAAVDKYQEAAAKGCDDATFWNDYGTALVELSYLIGRHELLYDASQLFRQATAASVDFFPAWLNLACCYEELYELSGSEDFFILAEESFHGAAARNATDVTLWLKWGLLYLVGGKWSRDIDRLEVAIQKFKEADRCERHHSLVLERWAEAEVWLGSLTEQLPILRQAENRILESLALAPDGANVWYVYGCCLNEIGHYFGEAEYYFHAVDKFQYGLSYHPKEGRLHYGIAQSYAAIGAIRGDAYFLEKASESFAEGANHERHPPACFCNDWGASLMRLCELTGQRRYLEEAISKFEYAIQMQGGPQDSSFVDAELLYNYGCALDYLGDYSDEDAHYQKSIEVLSQVVSLYPDYCHARYNLALAWSHLGELTSDATCFEQALQHFEVVVSIDGEDELSWNDWGLTLLNLSRLNDDPAQSGIARQYSDDAETKFLNAMALGSLQVFYNLACLYSLTGNYTAALHYLERSERAGVLPPIDDILNDEWLEGFRDTREFRDFIHQLANKIGD